MSRRHAPLAIAALCAAPLFAFAQATVKPDGQFHYALGAGASYSSGNTSAASANVTAETVRTTATDKFRLTGKALYTRDNHVTTAENATLATQYDRDFNPTYFGFGSGDYLRDTFANISARVAVHAGVGQHVVKRDTLTFDISAGLGYTEDRYLNPAVVDDVLRQRYGRPEAVFAEESSHKLTETTTFRQKLSLLPSLRSGGGYRGVFDSGIAVSMTPMLSLTVGLNYRYDSDPGVGVKHGDTLVVTGLNLKID